MGYNCNRIDASLADVIGPSRHMDYDLDDDWWYDLDYGYDPYPEDDEDDREAYYHGIDLEYDYDEPPEELDEPPHDPNEIVLPHHESVNLAWRPTRYYGKRRPKFNVKPKRKDHRR